MMYLVVITLLSRLAKKVEEAQPWASIKTMLKFVEHLKKKTSANWRC